MVTELAYFHNHLEDVVRPRPSSPHDQMILESLEITIRLVSIPSNVSGANDSRRAMDKLADVSCF